VAPNTEQTTVLIIAERVLATLRQALRTLAYLKRLPASKLKIDMSFVRDMIENASDQAIVNTIIGMGRTLGLRTIAESVETQEQAEMLLAMGCDEAQGFFLGRPESAAVFEQK